MKDVCRTIQFQHCKVLVWPNQQAMVTIFEDGTEVPATPNYDEESIARAHSLGYNGDVWAMTLDHEIGHTVLAEMDGKPCSPALWAVAHPNEKRDGVALHVEESRVMELQRFFRLHGAALKQLEG